MVFQDRMLIKMNKKRIKKDTLTHNIIGISLYNLKKKFIGKGISRTELLNRSRTLNINTLTRKQ